MTEDWEKDFSGLEKLVSIQKNKLIIYLESAAESNIRMEFKDNDPNTYEIWTPKGVDLTEFWEELKLHG